MFCSNNKCLCIFWYLLAKIINYCDIFTIAIFFEQNIVTVIALLSPRPNSSYRLQLCCDDSHIILLHSQGIPCNAYFWVGGGKNRRFMPHFCGSPFSTGGLLQLLTLDVWSRRPKPKWKAWGSHGLGMVTAWKQQKIAFCVIWSLFSYPTTYDCPAPASSIDEPGSSLG